MSKKKETKCRIGISIGDPNGIGLEVILKTFDDNRITELCTPIIFGTKRLINEYSKLLQLNQLSINYIKKLDDIRNLKLNVCEIESANFNLEIGKEEEEGAGMYAYESLEAAVTQLKEGHIDALVTAPINKKTIQSNKFSFPGHTEYLQSEDKADESLMLMLSERAKIGVASGHIPLSEVATSISSDLILKKITLLNKSLKEDFCIRKPKIAVMGLNPHAGDNGLLGKEEEEIISPAIQQAKSIGIMAFGPYAADGFFGSSNYKNYDGILAMYHDQGLIPAKSFSFGEGVNFTAGLSFIRTSPDHGTAFEIAGKGVANESSFRNALYNAIDIVKNRNINREIEEDVLVVNKNRN